jgi:hypothetical protein
MSASEDAKPGEFDLKETLTRLEAGDRSAADRLFPLVYDELRNLASSRMRRERVSHTLRPTALVHEVYAKIAGQHDAEVKSTASAKLSMMIRERPGNRWTTESSRRSRKASSAFRRSTSARRRSSASGSSAGFRFQRSRKCSVWPLPRSVPTGSRPRTGSHRNSAWNSRPPR